MAKNLLRFPQPQLPLFLCADKAFPLIGTWTRTAALGWVAFQITHSAFLLGLVFMLNSLPIFLFAIYAGSLADRVPKIRIFTFTSWFSLLSSLSLAVHVVPRPGSHRLPYDLRRPVGTVPPPLKCRPGRP